MLSISFFISEITYRKGEKKKEKAPKKTPKQPSSHFSGVFGFKPERGKWYAGWNSICEWKK